MSTVYICKQFGPSSGLTESQSRSVSKPFDTLGPWFKIIIFVSGQAVQTLNRCSDSNVLSETTHNARLSHFQKKKAHSSLCQCTASPELSLLALNEKKIGKFDICRVLKQRRLSQNFANARTHLSVRCSHL